MPDPATSGGQTPESGRGPTEPSSNHAKPLSTEAEPSGPVNPGPWHERAEPLSDRAFHDHRDFMLASVAISLKRIADHVVPHSAPDEDWKAASKALSMSLADERDRTIKLTTLLVHARSYVADSLDAHEHSDGRALLTDIDGLFGEQEHFPPCHNCGQDTVTRGPRGFVDCIACNPPPGRG